MKQVHTFISAYTADISAVCSALYELGGMIVIHDPSGCNSTYNTHDEPRWYDRESLIFISGLSEIDAIMGNDEKLIRDTVAAAGELQPAFIVLLQSPVPLLTGTDFWGIAREIAARTGIPAYFIETTGMHSYIWGAGRAFELLAKNLVRKKKEGERNRKDFRTQEKIRVNLLGVTPLDFSVNHTVDSLKEDLEQEGFEVQSCWAMGSDLSQIMNAGEAQVNLVAAAAGIWAAQVLKERFQIPFVAGLPAGGFARAVFADLREAAASGRCLVTYKEEERAADPSLVFIGEPVIGQSLAQAIYKKYRRSPLVVTMQDVPEILKGNALRVAESEEELAAVLKDADIMIADPLFQALCPAGARFCAFPQESCSGRIYRRDIPDYLRMF